MRAMRAAGPPTRPSTYTNTPTSVSINPTHDRFVALRFSCLPITHASHVARRRCGRIAAGSCKCCRERAARQPLRCRPEGELSGDCSRGYVRPMVRRATGGSRGQGVHTVVRQRICAPYTALGRCMPQCAVDRSLIVTIGSRQGSSGHVHRIGRPGLCRQPDRRQPYPRAIAG